MLILSLDKKLNLKPVHGFQNKNLLHVLPFCDYSFSRDGFDYNLNSFSKNVNRNDCDVLKKREMYFTRIIINSLLPIIHEERYIENITNASIIGISETKLDGIILSSELDVDDYD